MDVAQLRVRRMAQQGGKRWFECADRYQKESGGRPVPNTR
eukprot:CAMPEP_0119084352 /NCGR_PEP_ID=MMETSP1178-20130426/129330_1 /TAXON_ID=33656 /ORGANISM="unid sp, Strain CCMP2000" /LENGTH=39 /DNA_ID= /DNA_START= /DNA_END= /DNA_ORIENTATION=